MNKFDLKGMASALATAHNISEADAENFLKVVCDVILDALRHEGQIKIKGLGTFKLIGVPEREMIDVNTGERITVEARNRISYSPDSVLRDIINKPFIFFETVVLNDGVVFDDESETDESEEDDELYSDDARQEDAADSDESDDVIAVQADDSQIIDSEDDNEADVADDSDKDEVPNEKDESQVIEKDESVSIVDIESSSETPGENSDDDQSDKTTEADEESEEQNTESLNTEEDTVTDEAVTGEIHKDDDVEQQTGAALSHDETPSAVNEALKDARNVIDEIQSGYISEEDDSVKGLYTEDKSSNTLWIIFLVLTVLVAAGGILYGTYGDDCFKIFDDDGLVTAESALTTNENAVAADSIRYDSLKTSTNVADSVSRADSTAKSKEKEKHNVDPDFYDALDVRIRTGAYRIVGVYKTIVVEKGQTFKSITKAYLGEGMDCYMEALNGVKTVQPGDTLKIPKLEWRKKRKK